MVDDPNDPNKENQNGVNISGGAGADISTGIPGQDAGAGNKSQKSSGNYANIQSYLDANKDQGDQMGQNIASNIDQKAMDATNKINSLSSKAPTVVAYDPNAAYSKLGSLSDEEKNTYRDEKATGGYTGPDSADKIDGYADAQKAANEATGLVKNTKNEYGQQALLKNTYARPNYSAGENKLDQVLLQNSAGSKQALEGVGSKYSGLEQLFNDTNKNVGDSVNAANQQALANRNAIMAGEQQQWKGLIDPIQARADQMNRDNPALISRIGDDLSDETLSEETLSRLGLSAGTNIYNTNLKDYYNPNSTQVGLNEAANDQERSKYQALADLVQDQSRTQIDSNGKAIDPLAFDMNRFNSDIAKRKSEYDDAYNNLTGDHFLSQDYWNSFGPSHINPAAHTSTVKNFRDTVLPEYQRMLDNGTIDQYSGARQQYDILKRDLANFDNQYGTSRVIKKG